MPIFVASFLIFLLAILGMAAGVLLGRAGIRGSCGGVAQTLGTTGGCACADSMAKQCRRRRRTVEVESP